MAEIFDVSERYSKMLKEQQGPWRSAHPVRIAKAWIMQSSSRRNAARGLGVALVLAAVGWLLSQNRSRSERSDQIAS